MKKAEKTVESYIQNAPVTARAKLLQLRKIITKLAPQAEERLSYGMPYYGYKGRLAYFAFAKTHIGLYITPPVIAEHKAELKNYSTATATVRFPLDQKLPAALIAKLIKARIKKNEAQEKLQKRSRAGKILKTCSRGHVFSKSSSQPVCPSAGQDTTARKRRAIFRMIGAPRLCVPCTA